MRDIASVLLVVGYLLAPLYANEQVNENPLANEV
jgi:hypothetical protein